MKNISLLLFALFLGTIAPSLQAQDISLAAKKEAKNLIEQWEKYLDILGDPNASTSKVNQAKKKAADLFTSSSDYVYQDTDTTGNSRQNITVSQYLKEYQELSPYGVSTDISFAKSSITDVYVDKEQNAYALKVTLRKRININEIDSLVRDSIAYDTISKPNPEDVADPESASEALDVNIDTIQIVEMDTNQIQKYEIVDFYFHMDKRDNQYINIKFAAIAKRGKKPTYRDLSELATWWVNLDEEWQNIIAEQLNFPDVPSDYWLNMVRGIRKLILEDLTMTTYEPLYKFEGVEQLKLEGCNIDTLIYLKNMSRLRALNVNGTKITSLHGINARQLEFLFARDLQLQDIEALRSSTRLIELDISGNDIVDLMPISRNINMEELYCNANEIEDLSPLQNLTQLEKLHCGKNKEIKDLSPLKGMYNLVELDVFNTGVETLQPIAHLKKITRLDISFTKINTLLPMRHLVYLTYLAFSGNHLDNYGVLDRFPHLNTLKCSQTNISDISPLMKMEGLLVLYAPHTDFSKNDIQRFKKKHPKCQISYWQ